jgi:hypothetical protein
MSELMLGCNSTDIWNFGDIYSKSDTTKNLGNMIFAWLNWYESILMFGMSAMVHHYLRCSNFSNIGIAADIRML